MTCRHEEMEQDCGVWYASICTAFLLWLYFHTYVVCPELFLVKLKKKELWSQIVLHVFSSVSRCTVCLEKAGPASVVPKKLIFV